MRADLPAAVTRALARCDRPSLVFDLARIEANLRAFRSPGIVTLFAAKSFPHPAVRALAASILDGFDAASEGELAELPPAEILSIVDPSGRAGSAARARRVIVGCETLEQVAAAPAHAEIAIRLSASLTGRDPAVGAVQDGSGHRRSRFGLDRDPARLREQLAAMAAAARGRPIGLHVHHGQVAATSAERYLATAHAALAAAAAAGIEPRFLDLGGAWHAVADVPRTLATLRAAIPSHLELVIEPGRAFVNEAGFACGQVVVARELDDRLLRVLDLSRTCHLRWSPIELVGSAPVPATPALFVGPTCFEDDVLGEWIAAPAAGERVVFRGVTGYAVAWNASFGGIPAADVVIA